MRRRKRGKYFLTDDVITKIEELKEWEDFYRHKSTFINRVDIVNRIFFEKDEYEWIKNNDDECFVSSKYHRYYNLKSQKGIKAFNKLNEKERDFYFDRCKQTIENVYKSGNSSSFLRFYESIENHFVREEREKAFEYFDKYIKPEIQAKIDYLKEYEKKVSQNLKKCYRMNYFPSLVNAYLFEINQSKDEIKYNLFTKTGVNRFRKLSNDDKHKYLKFVKQKIYNFFIANKNYYSNKEHSNNNYSKSKSSKPLTTQKYYKILGLDCDATTEQVKRAYSKLKKLYHPDNIKTGNIKKLEEVNKAYNILMN